MISLGKLIVSTSTNDTCDSKVSRLCTASKFVGPWAILEEDNLSPYILGGVKHAVSEHNGGFQQCPAPVVITRLLASSSANVAVGYWSLGSPHQCFGDEGRNG